MERLDGWAAPVRATSRVKVKPRYLPCDPSVGVFACGLNERSLLGDASVFSRVLKSMALRDLLVYALSLIHILPSFSLILPMYFSTTAGSSS